MEINKCLKKLNNLAKAVRWVEQANSNVDRKNATGEDFFNLVTALSYLALTTFDVLDEAGKIARALAEPKPLRRDISFLSLLISEQHFPIYMLGQVNALTMNYQDEAILRLVLLKRRS